MTDQAPAQISGSSGVVIRGSVFGTTIAAATGRSFFEAFETAFVFLGVTVYCYAFLPAIRFIGGDPTKLQGETDPTNERLQFTILVVMSVMTVIYRRPFLALIRRSKGPVIITLFCLMSVIWSDAPDLTLRRVVVFSVTSMFAVYVSTRIGLGRFARILSWAALFMALASVVLIIFAPSVGLGEEGDNAGLPRGVFSTKNVLGFIMLLCSFFAMWSALGGEDDDFGRPRPGYLAIWLLCIGLAVMSRSGTVAVDMIAAYGTWFTTVLIRRWKEYRLGIAFVILTLLAAFAIFVILFPDQAAGLIGKDSSITGRDELWAAVEDYIRLRPWLGYGYAAFWRDGGPEAERIWALIQWQAPHAHNATLELLLEIGVVGTAIVSVFYLFVYGSMLRAAWQGRPWVGPMAAILVSMFLEGLTEGNALHPGDISWVLLLLAGFMTINPRPLVPRTRL